jgi:hypothetical protein
MILKHDGESLPEASKQAIYKSLKDNEEIGHYVLGDLRSVWKKMVGFYVGMTVVCRYHQNYPNPECPYLTRGREGDDMAQRYKMCVRSSKI